MNDSIRLNGRWNVVFDPENRGRARGYPERLPRGVGVPVPGVWELAKPGYDGVGWYGRSFELPGDLSGKTFRLRFGAVNYACQVWVNGESAGGHEGGYTPFVLDVTGAVKPGRNELVVRVVDPPRDRAADGFVSSAPLRQTDLPTGKAGWYNNFGGIWQDVDLLISGDVFIEDVFVAASCLRRSAVVECRVVNRGAARKALLTAVARPLRGGGRALFEERRAVRLKPGLNVLRLDRALGDFTPWDCEHPFLYVLRVEIAGEDGARHRETIRFGIRDFEVRDGLFLLNGRRVVLKGFLHQGHYPVTLAFPHDREMAARELRLLRRHGFNFVRYTLKPAPPATLDLADEMGLLFMCEPPMAWIAPTPAAAARSEREVREMVLRDRNHPCIVLWCLFNELTDAATVRLRRRALMRLARRLDPTRPVIGNAGAWGAGGYTEYLPPGSFKAADMIVTGAYYGPGQRGLTRFREENHRGRAALISEFSAAETLMPYRRVLARYTPAQRRAGLEDYAQYKSYYDSLRAIFRRGRLGRLWRDPDALNDAVDRLREEDARLQVSHLRVNPQWQGYAFCQLADASGEIFGATDLWRNPKRIFHGLAAAGRTPWVTPFVEPRVVRTGGRLRLRAWLVNEDRRGERYDIAIRVENAAGRAIERFEANARARDWSQLLLDESVAGPRTPGAYRLRVVARSGRRIVCENDMTFTVLPEPERRTDAIALFDLTTAGGGFFESRGYRVERAGNNYRRKDRVVVFRMNADSHPVLVPEYLGAVRRIVQAGGAAVFLEQDWPLFWWHLVPRPIRYQPMMRHVLYAHDHPVFAGLPGRGVLGHAYDDVEPRKILRASDAIANGGRVIGGALNAHMWTQPDIYFWGSWLDVLPLGRGHILSCGLRLLDNDAPIAESLLVNLINHAHDLIRPGGEAKLQAGRCIDDAPAAEYGEIP